MTRSGLKARVDCAVLAPNGQPCKAVGRFVVNGKVTACGRDLPVALEEESIGFVDGIVPVRVL